MFKITKTSAAAADDDINRHYVYRQAINRHAPTQFEYRLCLRQ